MADERAAFLAALEATKYPYTYRSGAGVILGHGGVVDFKKCPPWFSQVESVKYDKKAKSLILQFGDQTAQLDINTHYEVTSWTALDGALISPYYPGSRNGIKLYCNGYVLFDLYENKCWIKYKNQPNEELYDERFSLLPRISRDFSKTGPSGPRGLLIRNFTPTENYNPAPSITIITIGPYSYIAKVSECRSIDEAPFNFQHIDTGTKYILYTTIEYHDQIYCINEHGCIPFDSIGRYHTKEMTGIFAGCVPVTPTKNRLFIIGDVILEEFKNTYKQCPVYKPSSGLTTKAALRRTEPDSE